MIRRALVLAAFLGFLVGCTGGGGSGSSGSNPDGKARAEALQKLEKIKIDLDRYEKEIREYQEMN